MFKIVSCQEAAIMLPDVLRVSTLTKCGACGPCMCVYGLNVCMHCMCVHAVHLCICLACVRMRSACACVWKCVRVCMCDSCARVDSCRLSSSLRVI